MAHEGGREREEGAVREKDGEKMISCSQGRREKVKVSEVRKGEKG